MLDRTFWLIPSHVLCSQISGKMTLDDVIQINKLTYERVDEAESDGFYAILDFSHCTGYASDMLKLSSLKMLIHKHPSMRWLLVIDPSPHPVARFLGMTIMRLVGINFVQTHHQEEALDFIRKMDVSLGKQA